MATRNETAQNLAEAIKKHSSDLLTDDEAAEGACNLTGFFELLMQIDAENKQQE